MPYRLHSDLRRCSDKGLLLLRARLEVFGARMPHGWNHCLLTRFCGQYITQRSVGEQRCGTAACDLSAVLDTWTDACCCRSRKQGWLCTRETDITNDCLLWLDQQGRCSLLRMVLLSRGGITKGAECESRKCFIGNFRPPLRMWYKIFRSSCRHHFAARGVKSHLPTISCWWSGAPEVFQ